MKEEHQLLRDLKAYFKNTPREQIEADWAKTKEATKGIKSPTVSEFIAWQKAAQEWPEINENELIPVFRHSFRVLTEDEIMKDRSSAYTFLDFDNPAGETFKQRAIKEDNESSKGC